MGYRFPYIASNKGLTRIMAFHGSKNHQKNIEDKSIKDISFRRIGAAAMSMAIVAGTVLASCPSIASAATIKELNAKYDELTEVSKEKQAEYEKEADELEALMVSSYKEGDPSILDIITQSQSLDDLISRATYSNSMQQKKAQKVEDVKKAKEAADQAAADAKSVLERKKAQRLSLENADKIHFAQWTGGDWAKRSYWGGTVSTHGCGLCAYTVAIDILTGAGLDPSQMLDKRGDWAGCEYYVDGTAAAYTGTKDGTSHAEWTKKNFDVTMTDISGSTLDEKFANMDNALKNDEACVIVCSAGNYIFKSNDGSRRSSDGHYICVYRADDNGYYVQDSTYEGDKGTKVCYSHDDMAKVLENSTHQVEMCN